LKQSGWQAENGKEKAENAGRESREMSRLISARSLILKGLGVFLLMRCRD